MEEQLQNFYKELYEEELDSNQEELDSDEEELDKMNEDKLDLDKEIPDFDEEEIDSYDEDEEIPDFDEEELDSDEEELDSDEEESTVEQTSAEESTAEQVSAEQTFFYTDESTAEELNEFIAKKYTRKQIAQLFLREEIETKAEIEEKEKNLASAYDEDANQNSKKSIKSEESTESEESQESEESTESEESQESEESTESKKSTNFFIKKRESILFNMISHLRKMENEEKFHTYSIEKLFTPGISKLLKESGVNSMKDLLDFENLPNLTLFFANKERGEFDREFCRLFSYFHNLNNFRKSDYSHPEDSILLLFGNKNPFKDWLLNMIYRLKKMENEKKFHLYPIDKWFTPGVSRLLKKSGINNMKDLLDFENVSFLLLPFPNKETREFTVEFSRFHSIFYLLDKIDKKKKKWVRVNRKLNTYLKWAHWIQLYRLIFSIDK